MYLIVWQYTIVTDLREPFETLYGPDGEWASLFRAHQGYVETSLWRDPFSEDRYLTIDTWEDEAAYRAFRQATDAEYRRIDGRAEALTQAERFIGAFKRERSEANGI